MFGEYKKGHPFKYRAELLSLLLSKLTTYDQADHVLVLGRTLPTLRNPILSEPRRRYTDRPVLLS